MTTGQYVLPGYYEITQAQITSSHGAISDISRLITKFILNESIDSDCISGSIDLLDKVDFIFTLPIRGEETFLLTLKDAAENEVTMNLFIYAIDPIISTPQGDGVSYTLHFTSFERFMANLSRVRRSFNGPVSGHVQTLYDQFYKNVTSKPFFIEETVGELKGCIPNLHPKDAMKFFSERAFSDIHISNSFRFFENMNGIFFVTEEWLIEQGRSSPIPYILFNPGVDQGGKEKMSQMSNAKSFVVTNFNNTMRDLNNGAYRHKVVEIDLTAGAVTDAVYEYKGYRDTYVTTDGERSDAHDDIFVDALMTDENQKSFIVYKDFASRDDPASTINGYTYAAEGISHRIGYSARSQNTVATLITHGRLDLNAGGLVWITVAPMSAVRTDQSKNSALSGYYLIRSVSHKIIDDVYECECVVSRFDWGKEEEIAYV